MFVLARGAVWASAGAEFELADLEMGVEFSDLVVGGFAILLFRSDGAAGVEEGAVAADQVVLEHRGVPLRGGDVGVAEQAGDDVYRQSG